MLSLSIGPLKAMLSLSLSLLLFRPGMDTVIQLIQEEQQREATEVFNLVHEMAKDGGK